jgi:hypothetical protein
MITIAKSANLELINADGKYEIYNKDRMIFFSIDDTYACNKFKEYVRMSGDTKVEIDLMYWSE